MKAINNPKGINTLIYLFIYFLTFGLQHRNPAVDVLAKQIRVVMF